MSTKVWISMEADKELAQRARVAAAMLGVSRGQLIRQALTRELKRLQAERPDVAAALKAVREVSDD